ncbi:(2Fe-2S)-binding protein [Candidatus Bathyarchaeota archaeon]|nr:(2Fe-2S)-binding protein [Candidatus Bathyarchaeota archaeon]
MVKIINLEIDGNSVKAKEGLTILEVARQAGIDIPTLCYNEETEHLGGCRMCTVEVDRRGRKKTVAACSYPIEEGIKVTTRSQKIDKIRKTILELAAVGSGPDVASDMSALSREYKADLRRFSSRLQLEATKCILCGLCVSRCKEATYDGVIGFVGRGVNRKIAQFPELSQACASCNYCYSVCPTGRITSTGAVPRFPLINELLSGRS